jgi:hypothetical protein
MTAHVDRFRLPLRLGLARTRTATAAVPPLARGERILLTERDIGGGWVVATTDAIHCLGGPEAGGIWQRLGWAQTGRVDWDPQRRLLHLRGVVPGAPANLVISPTRGSALVALCRERVGATILACCRVTLTDGAAALVQARRQPGSAAPVWVVLISGEPAGDPDGDPGGPQLAAAIRQLRIELVR